MTVAESASGDSAARTRLRADLITTLAASAIPQTMP